MDGQLLLWIQETLRSPLLTAFFVPFTHLGDGGFLFIALTLLLFLPRKTRPLALRAALALLFSLLFTNILLKHLVARVRPFVVVEGLVALVTEKDPNSFPSGHTSAAFAFAFSQLFAVKKPATKLGLLVLAVVMALSRLYVGVHYPTDVLAGCGVGICAGLLGDLLGQRLWRWFEKKRDPSP